MRKNDNVKNWVDFWESSKGFFDTISDQEQAETWNNRWGQLEKGKHVWKSGAKKQKRMENVFKLLEDSGLKIKNARILDIGCGPGLHSIAFAKAGAKVTSLDISSTALEKLSETAKNESVKIATIETSWWSTDIDKLGLRNKFDLVFVTSTPAVRDALCLDKMMLCSKKYCYYSFFIKHGGHIPWNYEDVIRDVLKREPFPNSGNKGSMFVNVFMYIYLLGYKPQLGIIHNQRKNVVAWDEAASTMINFLERSEKCSSVSAKKIREYFKGKAEDGKITESNDVYSGMMVWDVRKQNRDNA